MTRRFALIPAVALLAAVIHTATADAAFTLEAPSAPATAPCTTASPACAEWISLGGGPQRALVYRTFAMGVRNEAVTRVFVLVHGAGRDADNYFRSATAAAFLGGALQDTLVISPRMASNDGSGCKDALATNEISWHCNAWRSGGVSLSHPGVTSFDFLDEILRQVARRSVFPNLKSIVVAGHSAGGQVVNRYEMTNQIHETLGVPVTYVISNPSSYAYPDDARPTSAAWSLAANAPGYVGDTAPGTPAFRSGGEGRGCSAFDQWPLGLNRRTGYSAQQSDEQIRRQLASRPATYLLGEIDILPLGGFDGSCGAMAQGPTRLARGQAFAKRANEKYGANHAVVVVPLCGHNARCVFTSEAALPLIFPKP